MGLPRSKYVQEGKEGVYHCFSRCVRRAFLYGLDSRTGRDYSHRKAWLVSRLRQLAGIFAVEVCAYAVMENHYHAILRTRPDIAARWSDEEVAARWLTLYPRNCGLRRIAKLPVKEQIRVLANCPKRIGKLRQRLSNLSWFMGRLNEYIARAANKEDEVKGRFWESRFKCQALLDEAAIAACMVYVDLNPIRAGRAKTPEESDFTSIQERIRAWRDEVTTTVPAGTKAEANMPFGSLRKDILLDDTSGISDPDSDRMNGESDSVDNTDFRGKWLCPISGGNGRRGILSMTGEEYFDLVDKSGRMIRLDKRGAIESDLRPILLRIGANPQAWAETISGFGDKFSLVAGLVSSLRKFADELGRRWFKGVSAAQVAFKSLPLQRA
jgi:REP element-mobilizing transposase RayT